MMVSPDSPSMKRDEESGENRRETAGEEEAFEVPEPIADGSRATELHHCRVVPFRLVTRGVAFSSSE